MNELSSILIIGKNGNLGSELVRQLEGKSVTAWDKEELDITNREEVRSKIFELKPSVVFNCAAYNNVDGAEENFDIAKLLNGSAPGFLAESCAEIDAILVHFSSDYVFNGQSQEGYNEDSVPDPINNYGKSKLMGEQEVVTKAPKYYIIRTSWLFGKKGPGELAKPSFVDIMLSKAKTENELQIIDDNESRPTYIGDLAKSSITLVEKAMPFGIYHIVNEGRASFYTLANEVFNICNIKLSTIPVDASEFPTKAKRPRYGFLNNTKLPKLRVWKEALSDYIKTNY